MWTIGSPSWVTTTWQKRFVVLPAGEVGSVLRWKTRSAVSLVIVLTSVVTLFGRPISVTFASPGKSTALFTLRIRSVSFPCSTLAAVNPRVRNFSATVSLAYCEETVTRPVGVSAEPSTTIFQVRSSAPSLALIGMSASSCFSGIVTPPFEATPGGFQGMETAIGAVKSGFRFATTFRSITPPRTIGTLGSTTSIENGASSATATASVSTVRVQNGLLFWPRTCSTVDAN